MRMPMAPPRQERSVERGGATSGANAVECDSDGRSDVHTLCALVLSGRLGSSYQRLGLHTRNGQLSEVDHAAVLNSLRMAANGFLHGFSHVLEGVRGLAIGLFVEIV